MTRRWVVAMASVAMLLTAAVASAGMTVQRLSPGKGLTIEAADGAGSIVADLSALKGAKVLRADLRIARTKGIDGSMDEAMVVVDIRAADKPLAVRVPWSDALDATEFAAAQGGKNLATLTVKSCPLPDARRTVLDVWLEGTPAADAKLPAQAAEVAAVHRAGQTFITFKETEDRVGSDEIAWDEMRKIVDALDAKGEVRYLVFRAVEPITAENLHQAELLATVRPLSGWDLNGRSFDRGVDKYIATAEGIMVGHWNPFTGGVDGKFGLLCPIDRLAIPDKEGSRTLPRTSGLYVHTLNSPRREAGVGAAVGAAQDPNPPLPRGAIGKGYYAVCTSVDGVVNTRDIGKGNVTGPVDEQAGAGEPVLQREMEKMPFFNYPQKRLHYVQWGAPPMTNLPSEYFNWSVGVPDLLSRDAQRSALQRDAQGSAPAAQRIPLELNIHRDANDYWRTSYRIEPGSVVLCPHDFPVKTWWFGHNEALGTLKYWRDGAVQPYTERRLLAFIDWACKTWPIDRSRILVTGCRGGASPSGALKLALRYPALFNLVIAGHATMDYSPAAAATGERELPTAQSLQAVFGKVDWACKTDAGKSVWDELNARKLLEALPAGTEPPYFSLTSRHQDADTRAFYQFTLTHGMGIMSDFNWGGPRYIPVTSTATFPNAVHLAIARDKPLLAIRSAKVLELLAGGHMGDFSRQFRWSDVVDTPARFEAALTLVGRGDSVADVTLRRPQAFKPAVGKTYAWTNAGGDAKTKVAQSGEAAVGDNGLLTLPAVQFSPAGTKLVIQAK